MQELIKRARYILNNSNILDLIKRSFNFFVFDYGSYTLYEQPIRDWDEADFAPAITGIEVAIARNNLEADVLAMNHIDFRDIIFESRRMLDKGAVAICLYSGREVAHITWLAQSLEAQKAIYAMPYKVEYAGGEACVGGTYTDPSFRGKGLMVYGNYLKLKYAKSIGITTIKHTIKTDNMASIKGYAGFSPVTTASCRYLRILNFEYWKEKPV